MFYYVLFHTYFNFSCHYLYTSNRFNSEYFAAWNGQVKVRTRFLQKREVCGRLSSDGRLTRVCLWCVCLCMFVYARVCSGFLESDLLE